MCQLMFRSELVSGIFCRADEYQISHVESVCLSMFVRSLHIPILVLAENLRDVIPVGQKDELGIVGVAAS